MSDEIKKQLFEQQSDDSIDGKLLRLLSLVRKHLKMDVAFISEFTKTDRVFKVVDNQTNNTCVSVGNSDPICQTYCKKISDNDLEPIIPNTQKHPITKAMPVTNKLNIGSYIGVPIVLASGKTYGTFCCYKTTYDENLNNKDLAFLKLISELASELIEQKAQSDTISNDTKILIENIIKTNAITIYYQPIFNLATNRLSGYESLSRFFTEPYKTPDVWFKEADNLGLGEALEILAIQNTLHCMDELAPHTYVTINTSPAHILSGAINNVLKNVDCTRIILEVTEHSPITNYQAMRAALEPLRAKGVKLAIDDVGAGFSSFQHILELEADIIKLDISLTKNINNDRRKFLLAKALCGFAKAINCSIVAEGIENEDELFTLRKLNVDNVQGYFIGRPAPIEEAIEYQAVTL
ncbi:MULTISPECIES: EAL domain-containing protein [unclassified Pseudoalteromonas]|uniref:sensor domain-containing phosphodiesterase n=1 Tax=unclassified Pseudoalteromonas TaxID=194690 RepID=UPI0006D685DE|nr:MULTISPECIES: EAL domain-containing protein [unclassified Pseudoalteromonas]KPZ52535.1 Cyclic di-GMP phosphodiesterase YfgF [Pseudoalteromonas sp. P1-25]KPZ62167.1 Cyclic di-GMP phosphodiesterase YfgF [Pseudoalteromonas sp. P1-7a]